VVGRFINADSYASTGQDILGHNMFAYCGNNPVARDDIGGELWGSIFGGIVTAVSAVTPVGWAVIVTSVVVIGTVIVYAEHTKNARPSTHDKHTKPRPGRQSKKKKQKPGWKRR